MKNDDSMKRMMAMAKAMEKLMKEQDEQRILKIEQTH